LNVLFISYDGLMEPLGQSQVRQYLRGLARTHRVTLLSFEKPVDLDDVARRSRMKAAVESEGIEWIALRYHKRPTLPATAFDMATGIAVSSALIVRRRIGLVHARGYVSATMALALKKTLRVPFIFDMRGFWADEKVESGSISETSAVFRGIKGLEARFLTDADAVVSLTHAAVRVMRDLPFLKGRAPRFRVIPTCTNLEAFHVSGARREASGRFVLGYVGAVGAWDVFDEVSRCFKVLLETRPQARLLVINRGGHDYIAESLAKYGVPRDRVEARAVDHSEVPAQIRRMDAGVFFYKPGRSRFARAPTKLGEFLASGVPCLTGAGVGDVDSIVVPERVGVVLKDATDEARREAVLALVSLAEDPEIQSRCASVAARTFSLDDGVSAYDALYRELEGART
jgi:glycosyltransferase involved in cell wall biosynthesis